MTHKSQVPLQESLSRAHRDNVGVTDGSVSSVYPVLGEADPDLLGIAVTDTAGDVVEVGDADAPFALMSCAKPFVFALASEARGLAEVRARVGTNATGLPFNSTTAVERDPLSRTNPMVNSGALVVLSMIPGDAVDDRWRAVLGALSAFAGRALAINAGIYASVSAANHRNRALAHLLADRGALAGDPAHVTDLYTRASCLDVTARDLAVMGATLAHGGVNPVTGARVVAASVARAAVAAMATTGLYETTGDWLLDVGVPGKSGIGGGIVAVSPGRLGLGTYAPRLDPAGNSVQGQRVAGQLARELGLDLFSAAPRGPA